MSLRGAWRRLVLGLPTILGLGHGGFFIPYRYAGRVRAPERPYGDIAALFDQSREAFGAVLDAVDRHAGALQAIAADAPAPAPRWNQDWFPRLDAAAAYALVRERRPKTIVEIGSGHSTRFLAQAAGDGQTGTRIVAIDPAPRARIAESGVEHLARTAEDADPALWGTLASSDMLFVDSSHILMPGTDVDLLLNRIMPRLPAGVLVHVHDIFLPGPYPAEWAWRAYNEQNAVSALLLSGAWRPVFSSRYAVTQMADRLARSCLARIPLPAGAYETSLWLARG